MPRSSRKVVVPVLSLCLVCAAAIVARAQDRKSDERPSTILIVPDDNPLKADWSNDGGAARPVAEKIDVAKPDLPAKLDGHDAPGHICTTGDAAVDAIVRDAGTRYGVDPCFITAVMGAESGYRRYAVSPKGASGYMQLMPDTARRFGVSDLFDTRQNIFAGAQYLRFLLDRFGGSIELALAGYNAGEGAVERYGRTVPPFNETRNYVRVITSRYIARHAAKTALVAGAVAPPLPKPIEGPAPPLVAWKISADLDAGSNE